MPLSARKTSMAWAPVRLLPSTKGVVTHKPEAKLCGFRLYGGIQIFPGEGGKRRVQGGFQKSVVAHTVSAAEGMQQLAMQQQNLRLCQNFHRARTS